MRLCVRRRCGRFVLKPHSSKAEPVGHRGIVPDGGESFRTPMMAAVDEVEGDDRRSEVTDHQKPYPSSFFAITTRWIWLVPS
jgi:hypothetical protein